MAAGLRPLSVIGPALFARDVPAAHVDDALAWLLDRHDGKPAIRIARSTARSPLRTSDALTAPVVHVARNLVEKAQQIALFAL